MNYFIRVQGTDLVKIGFTDMDPERRLGGLQCGCPYPLAIDRLIDGDQKTERALHAAFASRAVRGEWFQLTREDVDAADGALGVESARKAGLMSRLAAGESIEEVTAEMAPGRRAASRARILGAWRTRLLVASGALRSIDAVSCCDRVDDGPHADDCIIVTLERAAGCLA